MFKQVTANFFFTKIIAINTTRAEYLYRILGRIFFIFKKFLRKITINNKFEKSPFKAKF